MNVTGCQVFVLAYVIGVPQWIYAFDANELIHSVWELRQTALQLGESSGEVPLSQL